MISYIYISKNETLEQRWFSNTQNKTLEIETSVNGIS